MRLSNKLTFSLASIILLLAFAAVPAMANTMSATWSIDLDSDTEDNQSGWRVTLTYVTAPTTLPTDASFTVVGGTVGDFKPTTTTEPAAVAGTTKVFTFNVQLGDNSSDADITLADHRRVTLTNSTNLRSTSIYTPKLKSITAPKSAQAGTFTATIVFESQAAAAPSATPAVLGIGPATGLKATDITSTGAGSSVLSVTAAGSNTYTVRAVLGSETAVITLADAFPHQDAPDGDDTGTDTDAENRATVIYDDMRPTIGPIVFKSLTNRDLDTSSVTRAFDVYVDHITTAEKDPAPDPPKSITDDPDTVSDEEMFPLMVEFTVEPAARGATVSNEGKIDGKPAATITPKENTTTADWPATTLTLIVKVTDNAGNFAVKRSQFTVAMREGRDPVGPVDPVDPGDMTKPTVVSVTKPQAPIPAGEANAGSLVFTIMVSEALRDGTFTLSDLAITNVNTQTGHSTLVKDTTDTSGKTYKLTVTPADADFPVTVSFDPMATITDAAGNESEAAIDKTGTYTPSGVLGVTITAPDKPINGSLVFTFVFAHAPFPAIDEDGDKDIRAFTISDVEASNVVTLEESDLRKSVDEDSEDKKYYLTVTPVNPRLPVTVTLHSDAVVANAAAEGATEDLVIAGQVSATFTPDTTAPTLAITHTPADSAAIPSGEMLTFTFTFTDQNTIATSGAGAFTTDDVAVVGGAKGTFTATNNKTYTLTVTPTPNTNVTVTVAAGSVTDTAIPPNAIAASVSETWTSPDFTPETPLADGQFTIPANGFIVVVRNDDATQPGAVGLSFRSNVVTAVWMGMPDLQYLFDRNTPHGGGALVLEEVGGTTLAVGTVGISEIMWARDNSYIGEEAKEKASQWIELQNLNNKEVTVKLTSLMGTAITDAANGLRGNLAAPKIDAVTNFFNNRPGAGAWTVPGSNGDSLIAQNFVSMRRTLRDVKKPFANVTNQRFSNRDGRYAGHWAASASLYLKARTAAGAEYDYIGTPGRVNQFIAATQGDVVAGRTRPASNTIVINEVANREDDKYSWIELRNASGGEINLRNYMISIVTSNTSDVPLIQFPANDNAKIKAGGVFLILASDQDSVRDKNHPVSASGYNVGKAMADQSLGTRNKSENPVHYMVHGFALPDNGEFVLMVRRPDNTSTHRSGAHRDHGVAETGQNDLEKIVDIAGYHPNLAKSGYPNSVSSTRLWPLYNFDSPSFTNNKFDKDTVHRRNRTTTNNDRSGVGALHNNAGLTAFGNVGWTGVGYKRMAATTAVNGGTPGYGNGALPGAGGAITSAVYISEIMYADDARGNMPQWIELRNPSATLGADLHNWRLTITNHADSMADKDGAWTGKAESTVLLRGLKIKPNSSVLITSRRGPRHETYLADSDIFILYPAHRSAFGMTSPSSDIINRYGFKITLYANGHDGNRAKWQLVDEVGNLGATTDDRGRSNERFDVPRWMWPDANTQDGDRISVARTNMPLGSSTRASGKEMAGWILSSMDMRTDLIDFTYYGHSDDISTPGQTKKQPLPVELSFFRPTLEDGKIVVRWTTESELDNAGFNVYRSETHDGEFNQVNAELIQGAGTTGERNTYKWVDASAKAGQVYYYQIEDVSFAGERQMLATTKLRGLISAKNKLTTKWGEIKKVQ